MRTTVNIDDDVLLAAKALARRENKTAGQVISDLAREALTRPRSEPSARPTTGEFFGFEPLAADGVVVSNAIINELRDE